jgi:mitogen-activated protein kinase kinase kinase
MFEREISLLRRIEHRNIVRYLGCDREFPPEETEGVIKIYMEYMVGGSISSMLKQFGPFEEELIARFTR